ncbi:MAG: hydantoinase B/oxoprolinase family protein [Candidatus Sumerlaeia bacterium]|nr:hydantoinase B/oxoprolinase family protein [Candidatus Sumerlaeia bacterium]
MNPVLRELLTNRFRALVGDMGEYLRRVALSTNIRERLDYSCGLLDAEGNLVVNAPHIPVHLGAMPLCVKQVEALLPLKEGDTAITNHPGFGGSHLPDVTLVTPFFVNGVRVGYVANRAHHAEIGGRHPGSMVPDARELEEEGVVIHPFKCVEKNHPDWDRLESLFQSARYPSRSPQENLADLRAQLAANHHGIQQLGNLAREYSAEVLSEAMAQIQSDSDQRLRSIWKSMGTQKLEATEFLDSGKPLRVEFRVEAGEATFDFSGTGTVNSGNLNAPLAVVHSAVLYVLRLITRQEKPELALNSGLLNSVTIRVPLGTFLNPCEANNNWPAVMGGNVELSQRVVDTLLKAFGLSACSQGTMNNVVFGNATFGLYETLGGGAGATALQHGASAVHTHMTNTRITDPEILERRFPVRLREFSIRRGSGGKGKHHGGDGLVREYQFLTPVQVSFLGEHRSVAPYGMQGGESGTVGRQFRIKTDGTREELPGVYSGEFQDGEAFRVETPGGGAWGTEELES